MASTSGEVRLDLDIALERFVSKKLKTLIVLSGLVNALTSILYLVVLIYPQVVIRGFVEGFVSLTNYAMTNTLNGNGIYMSNIEAVKVVSHATALYTLMLLAISIASIIFVLRKRYVTASTLAYGASLSLVILSGVLRYLTQAFSADASVIFTIARNGSPIRLITSAGLVEYVGIEVSKTIVYRIVFEAPQAILIPLTTAATLSLVAMTWIIYLYGKHVHPAITPDKKPRLRVKKVGKPFATHTPIAVALALMLVAANAGVFTYELLQASLYPAQPATYFVGVSSPAQQSIGANGTSASVKATQIAQLNTYQILSNPDFKYTTGWSFWSPIAGTKLSGTYPVSDTSASDGLVAQITGTIPKSRTDEGYLCQDVTLPSGSIASISISATLRLASTPPSDATVYYFIGLYDPSTSTWVASTSAAIAPSTTYTTYSLSINPASVSPGKTYRVCVGVKVSTGTSSVYKVDFRIDSVYMYVTTQEYSFSNALIGVNSTKTAYAKLVLEAVSGNLGNLNAEIKVVNYNGASSTPISIVNGAVASWETSWVELPAVPSGYTSAIIYLTSKSTAPVSATLNIYLVVSTGVNGTGAIVYYPFVVYIS